MTRVFGILLRLVGLAAIIWAVSAGSNSAGMPWFKWLFIGIVVAIPLTIWSRQWTRGWDTGGGIAEAYARREIQNSELPSEFRFITHDTTFSEVTEKLGSASQVLQLARPHSDGDIEHFIVHQYNLPYEGAVFIMPQRPFEPDDKIRAVSMCRSSNDEELLGPIRS
jgi:hypothetical protein